MLTQEFSSIFLGYTTTKICPNCDNETYKKIKQERFKQSAFTISLSESGGDIYEECSICEHATLLSKSFMFKYKNIHAIYKELNDGKYLTIDWYRKLNNDQRNIYIKRLDEIKAFEIIEFLYAHVK